MTLPLPVRVDVTIMKGSDLNRTIWSLRTGTGAVIDLTAFTANTIAQVNYLTGINNTNATFSIQTVTDVNGGITWVANSVTTSNYVCNTYVYNTYLYDANNNATSSLYGVVEVVNGA